MTQLPAPVEGAADIAKLTTGIATAVTGFWFPEVALGAAIAAPSLAFAIDKFVNQPRRVLIEELSKGNIGILSDTQAAEFIPMAYRFLEAAKQGEFEHNLRILAAYIAGELKENCPEASNVNRVARTLEGLSLQDIRVTAEVCKIFDNSVAPPHITASMLNEDSVGYDLFHIRESLGQISTRGLLVAEGASRGGQSETIYMCTEALSDLHSKACDAI